MKNPKQRAMDNMGCPAPFSLVNPNGYGGKWWDISPVTAKKRITGTAIEPVLQLAGKPAQGFPRDLSGIIRRCLIEDMVQAGRL